jgi:hypothetical protein
MTELYLISEEQLTFLTVQKCCRFLWAPRYDVRLIHRDSELNPPIIRARRDHELLQRSNVKWLRLKNAGGYNIFFRPISREFVLVDDLDINGLEAMHGDGIRTAVEIKTSKANFQAWIRVADRSRRLDRETINHISRYLAYTYGSDMRSAKPEQLGRLPGFRNRDHEQGIGQYPLVRLRRAVFTGQQEMLVRRALSTSLPAERQ